MHDVAVLTVDCLTSLVYLRAGSAETTAHVGALRQELPITLLPHPVTLY